MNTRYVYSNPRLSVAMSYLVVSFFLYISVCFVLFFFFLFWFLIHREAKGRNLLDPPATNLVASNPVQLQLKRALSRSHSTPFLCLYCLQRLVRYWLVVLAHFSSQGENLEIPKSFVMVPRYSYFYFLN